ncbi:hypothetical protein [Burkholderia plantarii]|uniref:hypothetical protein n=1 Tax=Burkholderia plantarii TaxID=41899 RepID=UPI000706708E|nr:hypothetical protein [Burkholderia plantarii]ALK32920.1 hypothetical protein bpln_2g06610 [Burkholderia plantarii]GLZ20342.1 hypothetical protein Bpla01_38710 [Burkholderia plantarii]
MRFLLAFLPALSFFVMQRIAGVHLALVVAALAAAGRIAFYLLVWRTGVRAFDLGSLLIFGGLAAWEQLTGASLSFAEIRLVIDAGLMLVALISVLAGRPFTLQYVERGTPTHPRLLQAHAGISAAWAAAFAGMDMIDFVWIVHPGWPQVALLGATALLGFAALRFTRWYPRRLGLRAAAAPR